MDNIDLYIKNKKNPQQIKYPHESLKGILKETYGIIIYQEQIMQILQLMAGYSFAQAD
jgi:DNA polymerase-3 subunit alpha